MKDKIDTMINKKVKVELMVRELYLLSVVACKGVSLSKKILKSETLDDELLKALNTILKYEIPMIACKVMDQIGIFRISEIIPESNNKKYSKKEN